VETSGDVELETGNGTQAMLNAILAVSSDLDLHSILNQIVASACDVTHAGRGFLGVLGENGELIDYVVHGYTEDEVKAMGDLPFGLGLISNPHPLRLRGLGDHPEAYGFPANHPPGESFLSMPVRIGDAVFGNLYLSQKDDGEHFTNGDEARVDALARVAGLMVRNARRYAVSERRREWVEASAEIAESLHDATRIDETLSLIVSGARRVSRAALVAVVRHTEGGFEVPACSGDPSGTLPVLLDLFSDEIDLVRQSSELLTCRYDGDGTAVIVPLTAQLSDQGVMLAILERGRGRLLDEDRELVSSFVAHASLALDRAQAIVDRHELMLVHDRDRIARDLHDLVIQRLFATGLQLQGARRFSPSPEGQDRIDTAVQELDQAIRDIRSTIYELQHGNDSTPRADLNNLIREYAETLGFTPQIRVIGALDSLVNRQLADQLLAVAREALSNCARHAQASACLVEVEVDSDWLLLAVTDNGQGVSDEVRESGLRNLRRRAQQLGGEMTLEGIAPHGTCLSWRVPTGA
jgi:signal transduction histidine kinase